MLVAVGDKFTQTGENGHVSVRVKVIRYCPEMLPSHTETQTYTTAVHVRLRQSSLNVVTLGKMNGIS
jgi:hypothetical protein